MKYLGTVVPLVLYLLVLVYAVVQFALDNCGVIALILALILLLPRIVRYGWRLYRQINDQQNWER